MTITISAWVIPLVITILMLGWSIQQMDRDPFFGWVYLLLWAIISLTSWLVWALIKIFAS